MSPIPEPQKDTIYLDVDDEITGIIDEVKSSASKIVALVLPKRATVLHSVVNMKLLKRAADDAKKRIVLITSEAGVLPLAGVVGLHVAKTLQSKPEIPTVPNAENDMIEEVNESDADVNIDPTKPVGVLAGITPDEEETIEVDNSDKPLAEAAAATKTAKNKKLKIPNFEKFRTRLFLAIGVLILLIVGWVFAAMILPKATITIKTKTSNIASKLNLIASPAAKELNKEGKIVPAMNREFKKTDAAKAPATGDKNVGEKAKGTVKIYNCNKADKLSDTNRVVPAGTGLSAGSFTFVLTESATVEPSSFVGDTCQRNKPSSAVAVVAQNSGDQYNLNARKYSVAGFASMDADGSDMAGGTSKIVKVVAQADVDSIKQKILDQYQQAAKTELIQQLSSTGYIALPETFSAGSPVVTTTPNVGDEASEVNVSVTSTFTMTGAKEDEVKQLVEDDVNKQIDVSTQQILDNGLTKAAFQITEKMPNGDVKFNLATEATAGVQQDEAAIKQAVAGKKRRDTQSIIEARPGIEDVTIRYSPFWVVSTPKKQSKIIINFE